MQELSLKQQRQKLLRAKATAKRAHQDTPKLDQKLEKIETLLASTIQPHVHTKPSPSKYITYKDASKRPVQGGKASSK